MAATIRTPLQRQVLVAMQTSTLERAVAANDLRMRDIELKLTDVEMTSYDGTLVWKVTDVSRRRRDAISSSSSSSINSSLQSPAFYTSRSGQTITQHTTPTPSFYYTSLTLTC